MTGDPLQIDPEWMDFLANVRIVLITALLLVPVFLGVYAWRSRSRYRAYILAGYGFVYVVLSAQGEYEIINHGGRDWRREWHPKWVLTRRVSFVGRPEADFTWIGYAYWPCRLTDSLVWHRTQLLEDY